MRDVGMIQRGEALRLALEAREAFGIRDEHLQQDFDRHLAIELRIARDRPRPSRPSQ